MSDTQWPRYQVFVQEKPGEPYQDAGSVHAPDAEMALLNARDVFARRPSVSGMWGVPAGAIFSRTAQEIELQPLQTQDDGEETWYRVCAKERPAGTQTVLMRLKAASPAAALRLALDTYAGPSAPYAWWVFPESEITASREEDVESLYTPAEYKTFRLSSDFHTVTVMRSLGKGHRPDRVRLKEGAGGP
ncbi:MAG: phenylacetic acid degradation protein [Chloroflexi bacterium]|nr:phenylacetic acid degradation protein [Chloroflexota bacterium]